MIYSMTGYAHMTAQLPNGTVQLEIRSLNHRFLDLSIKCIDEFKPLENTIREAIAKQLSRGKVDLRIYYKDNASNNASFELNLPVLQQYKNIIKQIQEQMPELSKPSITDIMLLPHVLSNPTTQLDDTYPNLLEHIKILTEALIKHQAIEGETLKEVILDKLQEMEALSNQIRKALDLALNNYQEKLKKRIADATSNNNIEIQRFQQEVAYFCQKSDIDEEVTRLQSHIKQATALIKKGGKIGKELDFLSQEMHRETNTFNAKSISIDITKFGLSLKVIIEQIKEQIQNIA